MNFDYGPSIDAAGVLPGTGAISCVTVDFDVTTPSRYDDNRNGTIALLELAERYAIPLTWAVCGKSAEEDMKSYSAIVNSSILHEIGVHTYSHLDATACTSGEFRADIQRCIQTLGLDSPRSFVFPWNREAHFDVLSDMGFRAYRGKARAIGIPVKREGLWNIRPVYYLDQKSRGAQSLINSYIDLCIRHSLPFHLWTHPWCMVSEGRTEPMMKTLEAVFSYMRERRADKTLATPTLGEIGASLDTATEPNAAFSRAVPLPSRVAAN
ncbi:MAG: polysaccharide deacetylase family protein [Thaumarchaeota archaeon]|nr:polysaccharide deacetylase family protein [Nitrososphaerota archaeon]